MDSAKSPPSGKLIVTLDFEIGWGVWETGRWRARQEAGVYRRLRPALRHFVKFLGERELALTWAAVGAMVADRHSGDMDHLPADARQAIARFVAELEPASRDGRDLLDLVLGCRTRQGFASHSYSHTRFSYAGYGTAAQAQDLRLAHAALEPLTGPIRSFVFPENDVGSFAPVAEVGLTAARMPPPPRGTVVRLLGAPPLARDRVNEFQVHEQTGSMFFNWFGRLKGLRRRLVLLQARRGLELAARRRSTFHVWLHPFNLTEREGLAEDLQIFLTLASDLRDRGGLAIEVF